jgi:hypothetical protein
MAIIKWNELQLKFNLPGLDEGLTLEEDAAERLITPEEARQISEAARLILERNAPTWQHDYILLRERGWPWRVACYMAWASSPRIGRKPGTLQELATTVLGLTSPRVVYTWRQKYPSIDTVITMMQASALWSHRRDVLDTLAEMAAKEDYKSHNDRKLYLEMTGDYTPRSMVGVGKAGKDGSIEALSDEELRAWMGAEPEGSADNSDGRSDATPLREEEGDDAGE